MDEINRFISKTRGLCQRRHGNRHPKFEEQLEALGKIAARRYHKGKRELGVKT